jgi:predicted transcriptional regulator
VTIDHRENASVAITLMKDRGFSQLPVVMDGYLVGLLHEKDLLDYLLSSCDHEKDMEISTVMNRNVATVEKDTPLSTLQELLRTSPCVVMVDPKEQPTRLITNIDLVQWLVSQKTLDLRV